MGASMHIKGIREPDDEFRAMREVYLACKKAGVAVPDRVQEFFDWQEPSDLGIITDLDLSPAVNAYNDGQSREGFDVEISKLPSNITHIRFYLSW